MSEETVNGLIPEREIRIIYLSFMKKDVWIFGFRITTA